MAGGVSKGFGGVLLAIGILLVLAGGAAVAYATVDQQENEDRSGPGGAFEDRERSDQNEALLVGGAAALGLGLILALVGGILLGVGGARARRAQSQELLAAIAARSAPQAAVTAPGAPAPNAMPPSASAASTSPAPAVTSTAARRSPSAPAAPAPKPTSRRSVVVGTAAAVAVVVIALVGLEVGLDNGSASLFGADRDADGDGIDDADVLAETEQAGRMRETVTVLGSSQSASSSAVMFTAPAGTGRALLDVNWTAGLGGADTLEVLVEVQVGDTWVLVGERTGGPGLQVKVADERLDGAALRVRVFPGEDGASSGQDFVVHARFLRPA